MSGRKRSCIWEFFKKDQCGSILCLLCKKNVLTKGNTSNLHAHIKHKHPLQLRIVEESKKRDMEDTMDADSENETRYLYKYALPTYTGWRQFI